MALMLRINVLSSRIFDGKSLTSLRNYSLQHLNSHRILNHPCLTQTSLKQRNLSSDKEPKERIETSHAETITGNKLSQKARLKQAVRDYGATIIVFHVAISLTSLGICYVAVSNGVDAVSLLTRLGFPESVISSKVAVESSTFVMSYAVHKLFAPVRIGITLSAAPFIVRYLRNKNWIKPSK